MDTLTYWNGTWHEGNPAILGPRDHAFWLGSIVFDGGRAFEGCGPDLDLHAERVVRSATFAGPQADQDGQGNPRADARGRSPLRAQGRTLCAADVLGDQRRRGTDLGRSGFHQFLLCVYHSPMRAGTPLTLGLCRTIRRPTPESAPTDAKASLPLSQFLARRGRDASSAASRTASCSMRWATWPRPAAPTSSWPRAAWSATPVPNGTFLAGITRNRTVKLLRNAGVTVEERTVTLGRPR